MNARFLRLAIALCLLRAFHCTAATLYVDLNSPGPASPYATWATAATNLQGAMDVAAVGDLILVADGVYQNGGSRGARVAVTNQVTLQSVDGPATTIIQGQSLMPGVSCAYVADGATLSGFTLTNGLASDGRGGGGVYCETTNARVVNCVISGNSATFGGGGSGGAYSNCTFINNYASTDGGAVFGGEYAPNPSACVLNNCQLIGNTAKYAAGAAYGAYSSNDCVLDNCTLSNNVSTNLAAAYQSILINCTITASSPSGAYLSALTNCSVIANVQGANNCLLDHCVIGSNLAGGAVSSSLTHCSLNGNKGGSFGMAAFASTLRDCLVASNTIVGSGTAYGSALFVCTLYNCTVVQNYGGNNFAAAGGEESCTNYNSIICSNTVGPLAQQTNANYLDAAFNFCCTMPLPADGLGNITNSPLFVDLAGGNARLQSISPCINAGNNSHAPAGVDLDNNPRISGGTVDMGAYEFQNPASIISYAWLQQYGLATDGSADYADTDHNGMNNWQKWVAGLDPTNPSSVLQMLNPVPSGTNIVVTWQSVTNINYFLRRSASLAPGSLQPLATNIPGQADTTSYTDTNAQAPGPWFYRVGVQQGR